MTTKEKIMSLHLNPIVQWADIFMLGGLLIGLGVNWNKINASDEAQSAALESHELVSEQKLLALESTTDRVETKLDNYIEHQNVRDIRLEDKLDRIMEQTMLNAGRNGN